MKSMHTHVLAVVMLAIIGANAWADISPPVKITMPADSPLAAAGQMYEGVWRVHVGVEGTLSDFDLSGDGWNVVAFDPPAAPYGAAAGVVEIPFRAVPSGMQVTYRCQG